MIYVLCFVIGLVLGIGSLAYAAFNRVSTLMSYVLSAGIFIGSCLIGWAFTPFL